MTTFITPSALTQLGQSVIKYFNEINRALGTLTGGSGGGGIVEVPVGNAIVKGNFSNLDASPIATPNPDSDKWVSHSPGFTAARADYPELFEALEIPVGTDSISVNNSIGYWLRVR